MTKNEKLFQREHPQIYCQGLGNLLESGFNDKEAKNLMAIVADRVATGLSPESEMELLYDNINQYRKAGCEHQTVALEVERLYLGSRAERLLVNGSLAVGLAGVVGGIAAKLIAYNNPVDSYMHEWGRCALLVAAGSLAFSAVSRRRHYHRVARIAALNQDCIVHGTEPSSHQGETIDTL